MKTGIINRFFIKKHNKGAVTVEYAVIFPVVVICILILIYIGMLFYQQCMMQSAVNRYVRSLAHLWGYNPDNVDYEAGISKKETYLDEELYWHLFADTQKRAKKATESVRNELMAKSIIRPKAGFDVQVTYSNVIISKKIGINARAVYPLPFRKIFELLGSSGYVTIEAYGETSISDPPEFIRNTDYLLQIYEESGAKKLVLEKLEPLADVLGRLTDFMK